MGIWGEFKEFLRTLADADLRSHAPAPAEKPDSLMHQTPHNQHQYSPVEQSTGRADEMPTTAKEVAQRVAGELDAARSSAIRDMQQQPQSEGAAANLSSPTKSGGIRSK